MLASFVVCWLGLVGLVVGLAEEGYLRRINKILWSQRKLLFTQQQASIVNKFETEFDVQIVIQSAFPEADSQCDTFTKIHTTTDLVSSLDFLVNATGTFKSARIESLLISPAGPAFDAFVNLTSPAGQTQIVYSDECGPSLTLSAGFDDGGVPLSFDSCNNIEFGSTVYAPTEPFSQFSGTSVDGPWRMTFEISSPDNLEVKWQLCYYTMIPTFTRAMAASLLNCPTYSALDGVYSLTSVYSHPLTGLRLFVTISLNSAS